VDLSFIKEGHRFILKSQKYSLEKKLRFIKNNSKGCVVKFLGVDNINESFKLVGYEIFSDIPVSTVSNRNYEGFRVIDLKNSEWGIVEGFESEGMNRIIKVNLNGKINLVPFSPPIVCNIDTDSRVILIDPPEGLRDLN